MPLEPLFHDFRSIVESRFIAAKADAGVPIGDIALQIEETPLGKGRARAEFVVLDPAGPVRITWNGIASLWAFSQGASRLGRRMFDGKRKGENCLPLESDAELERGLDSLILARRFCFQDIPADAATSEQWPSWAPQINASPPVGSDDEIGNRFFLAALDWILRHEIAHVTRHHSERQKTEGLSDQACEMEADLEATRWLRGQSRADSARPAGTRPDTQELQLEWRAISIGLGLIWVALFEVGRERSGTHPPVAERLFACLEELGLREDSAAAEILSDIIHAWIDPEEHWAPPGGYATARHAFEDAVLRLHRHI